MDDTKIPVSKSDIFQKIASIEPQLNKKAEQLLCEPGINLKHQYFRYSRHAVALAKLEKDNLAE